MPLIIILLLIALAFPFIVNSLYYVRLAFLIAINIIIVSGLNIVSGYGGQWSLAQSGFYAIGAYTTALLTSKLGVPIGLSLPAGILLCALSGLILGIVSIRVRDLYLAMITLSLAIVIERIISNLKWLTGGPDGVTKIPSFFGGSPVTSTLSNYYVVLITTIVLLIISYRIINSHWGLRLKAMRDNEIVAQASGVNIKQYKISAFIISAVYAGIAGELYAHASGYISPDIFNWSVSVQVLVMLLFGGIATFIGPVIGAGVLTLLPELIKGYQDFSLILYGIILIVCLAVMPKGIMGLIEKIIPHQTVKIETSLKDKTDVLSLKSHTEPNKSPVIEIKEVSKFFGGVRALEDICIDILQKTVHAIIGPNGAGKSTLINVVTGIDSVDKGEVLLKGNKINHLACNDIVKKGISRTFQNIQIFPSLTVLESVLIGDIKVKSNIFSVILRLPSLVRQELIAKKHALEILKLVGLDELAYIQVSNLSYGHQKLVDIARSLASEPEVLFLDEPAAGLNASEIVALENIIRFLKKNGITVVLIDHHIAFVIRVSDIVSVLDYGVKISQGKPDVIQNDKKVISAYMGV
jgi:ABC-type branched-subunit amino acid transport system ATPase component/ABC-type branched-subunit amino acid transport system permease subunit